jgi:hypothetical protein
MANVVYPQTSPYYTSTIYKNTFLDIMQSRPIPAYSDDVYWQITMTYNLRPDLLAYDLYNDSKLWWVFAQRNPNRIKDPLFDFITGTYIYLPQQNNLKTLLGI